MSWKAFILIGDQVFLGFSANQSQMISLLQNDWKKWGITAEKRYNDEVVTVNKKLMHRVGVYFMSKKTNIINVQVGLLQRNVSRPIWQSAAPGFGKVDLKCDDKSEL